MNFFEKYKETLSSVLPVMIIVLVLGVTIVPLGAGILVRFVAGGFLLIFGLTLFLAGVDLGILPVGERCGAALTAKRNLALLLGVSFLIGVLVTVAEPDVQVLADQIKSVASSVNKWALIFMIAAGIGLFVVVGLLRTILSLKLKYVLIVAYTAVFALAFLCPKEFQGVAFDAGGATTGPMTVPFIMALGVGVAAVRSKGLHGNAHSDSSDDSFGLTGIASVGPVAAVCVYGILLKCMGSLPQENGASAASVEGGAGHAVSEGLNLKIFAELLPEEIKEVSMALLPLVIMFASFQFFLLKMPPVQFRRVLKGLAYSFIGLVIFLTGVNGGFMPAGQTLGLVLGERACADGGIWIGLLTVTGVLFGAVVVCAEPAVWVLTEQVEQVSGGTIRRKAMLFALSAGVAISIGLSMLRIMYGFSLWYVLVPGYALALVLSLFCPPMFVGIAFDSGGVASGPMTSTFILSFTLGAAAGSAGGMSGGSAADAFGVIALVAMTPLIAIQMLGLVFKIKTKKES